MWLQLARFAQSVFLIRSPSAEASLLHKCSETVRGIGATCGVMYGVFVQIAKAIGGISYADPLPMDLVPTRDGVSATDRIHQ